MRSPRRPAPLNRTPPSDGIRSSQGRSPGFVCGRGSGGVAVPSYRLCPVFESLGVVFPYLRGSILSRLMSFIRRGLGHWVLCRRRCLQRRGYPQWIRPALTSNSAKKQDRDAENVRCHPPDPFTYAPRAMAQSLDGGAAELWGLVGRACVWRQDFGLGHVSDWGLRRLAASSMMCGVYEEVDLRPEPVTYLSLIHI